MQLQNFNGTGLSLCIFFSVGDVSEAHYGRKAAWNLVNFPESRAQTAGDRQNINQKIAVRPPEEEEEEKKEKKSSYSDTWSLILLKYFKKNKKIKK